jgi:hypothetical protein
MAIKGRLVRRLKPEQQYSQSRPTAANRKRILHLPVLVKGTIIYDLPS